MGQLPTTTTAAAAAAAITKIYYAFSDFSIRKYM